MVVFFPVESCFPNLHLLFRDYLGKHDCWEFDSGARDLSPEPSTLQRLIDTAGGSANTGNLLQLANKVCSRQLVVR